MRKILVNTQITAMISILETSTTLSYVFIVFFAIRTSYASILQLLVLYCLIVPYSLLMNTSHNKNRVIEHGWKNVFKNLFGKFNNSSQIADACSNALENPQNGTNELKDSPPLDNSSKKIFTTTSSGNVIDAEKNIPYVHIPSLCNDEPSTSKGVIPMNAENTGVKSLNVNNLPETENNQDLSQKLVLDMFYHIDTEDQYIEYFKKLVTYDEGCKNGNSLTIVDLEEEFPLPLHSNTGEPAIVESILKRKGVLSTLNSSDKTENCAKDKMLPSNGTDILETERSDRTETERIRRT